MEGDSAHIIRNRDKLISLLPDSGMEWVFDALEYAIAYVNPFPSIHRFLRTEEGKKMRSFLDSSGSHYVTGAGKASAGMASAIAELFPDSHGVINSSREGKAGSIRLHRCSHPLPDVRTVENTRDLIDFQLSTPEDASTLFLLSGGASSMLCLPLECTTLEEKRSITSLLISEGAGIEEINCVRRHISAVKGGRFSSISGGRRIFTLAISDIVDGAFCNIGSGPTSADQTTCKEALSILSAFHIAGGLSSELREWLSSGKAESVKPGDPRLSNTTNFIIADNRDALNSISSFASMAGGKAFISDSPLTEEITEAAGILVNEGRKRINSRGIFVMGGETVVKLGRKGRGGRCQHLAMLSSPLLRWDEAVVAIGTDGKDGNSVFAGGLGLPLPDRDISHFLHDYSSEIFHSERGTGIITGDTGTNVADIYMYIKFR